MKSILLVATLLMGCFTHAQNVGIGTNKPKAKLHVAGDIRIDSLANIQDSGLVLHNQQGILKSLKLTGNKNDFLSGDGSFVSLNAVAATGPSWLTSGNAGVDTAINFLGTIDNRPLLLRVNNIRAGEINPASGNIALGLRSLPLNKQPVYDESDPKGFSNVAIGTDALKNNTTGHNIIAIGDSALFHQSGTTFEYLGGALNLGIGSKALFFNVEGAGNTAIGENSLYKNLSSSNTAFGTNTLMENVHGNANSAFGYEALKGLESESNGHWNTAVGYRSSYLSGTYNTSVGMLSLTYVQGFGNTAIGTLAMVGNGFLAGGGGISMGNYNTAVGYRALSSETEGPFNPYGAIGEYNVAIGAHALAFNESGFSNTALGNFALNSNIDGNNLLAIGDSALFNQINNSSGFYSNSAIGSKSLYRNTTGYYNTATGFQSMYSNTIGKENVATGYLALRSNTSGSNNTAIGNQALFSNSTASNNSAYGYQSLF